MHGEIPLGLQGAGTEPAHQPALGRSQRGEGRRPSCGRARAVWLSMVSGRRARLSATARRGLGTRIKSATCEANVMNKLHTRWAEARLGAVAAMLALSLAACASTTEDIGDTGLGPRPELPSPQTSLLPTINIAPVQTRPSQSIPTAPPGFTVTAFASGLEHPRWVYPLPDGDLLVAESNAPAQHDEHG